MTKKIYVVDDDPDMTKVMGFRLQKGGYDVATFSSGEEALQNIKQAPPDFLLLDIQMPGIGGADIEKELNKDEKLAKIPIIFLTGKTDFDQSQLQSKGNRDFFLKPCDFSELIAKIQEMVG